MRSIRGLVVALLGVVVVVGLAGPAQAQGNVQAPGVPEGFYNVDIDGQAATTWDIRPVCVPTVGDLREPLLLPVACRLHITPASLPASEAVMIDNQWQFGFDYLPRTCPDGSEAPQQTIYRFDPFSLVGSMKVIHGDECGDAPAMVTAPLTMSFNAPPPKPITEYPLLCEPGGIRRCF